MNHTKHWLRDDFADFLQELANSLDATGRHGTANDQPEGARYIVLSDTLASSIAARCREFASGGIDENWHHDDKLADDDSRHLNEIVTLEVAHQVTLISAAIERVVAAATKRIIEEIEGDFSIETAREVLSAAKAEAT